MLSGLHEGDLVMIGNPGQVPLGEKVRAAPDGAADARMSPPPAPAPLTSEQLHALRRLDACLLANAIETFNLRLRNEGFVITRCAAFSRELAPMVGYAATVRIRGSAPPTAGSTLR